VSATAKGRFTAEEALVAALLPLPVPDIADAPARVLVVFRA